MHLHVIVLALAPHQRVADAAADVIDAAARFCRPLREQADHRSVMRRILHSPHLPCRFCFIINELKKKRKRKTNYCEMLRSLV